MKYCEKCCVHVEGNHAECPLCQSSLSHYDGDDRESFPYIPTMLHGSGLFFRILMLISVIGAAVCVLVNLMVPQGGWWSAFVVLGLVCLWVSIAVAVKKRRNIAKNLLYQVVVVSVLCLLWDWLTGRHGWALDYVIPITCGAALLVLFVVTKVMKRYIEDHVVYLLLGALFGIVPVIFLATGMIRVILPSLICIAVSITFTAVLVLFESDSLKKELHRRLHL